MARKIKSGALPKPDEDLQADMYSLADELFSEAGFDWYEVSNFSFSEATRSKHNLAYWNSQDWWGYGPGAHSHLSGRRWWNVKHPATYSAKLADGTGVEEGFEELSDSQKLTEQVLLQIRIASGLDMELVRSLPGYSAKLVSEYIASGLIDGPAVLKGSLVLTLRGRLLADSLVRQLTA
jgi:oxygen-independent coproporphyrinogen-3 oxidase